MDKRKFKRLAIKSLEIKTEKEKEHVEVEITTREYDHAEAIKRATENLCGEVEE